jgi:hypothetical protein
MLLARTYSLWMTPGPDQWTVIFSTAGDMSHEPYPGEGKDALRLNVTPERGVHMETLTFYFPVVDGRDCLLRMHWGEIIVPIRLRVPN